MSVSIFYEELYLTAQR